MLHQCLDCTYTGKLFPGGACPACGSFRIKKVVLEQQGKPLARKPFRLVLALVLWVYLVIEVYEKLS